jgi:hypothetical protein
MSDSKVASERYLATRGLSLAALVEIAAGEIREGETLFLVGSIPCGLANSRSDIDLFVLPGQPREAEESERVATVIDIGGGREVNFDRWPYAVVDKVRARMNRWDAFFAGRSEHRPAELDDQEYKLVHELRVGVPIRNEALCLRLKQELRTGQLPLHAILTHLGNHFALREDAIAQVEEGDPESALWMLRTAMFCLAEADVAALGVTNHHRKWLLRHIDMHRQSLGEAVRHAHLRHMCVWPQGDKRAAIKDALAFADERIENIIAHNPAVERLFVGSRSRVQAAPQLA